MKAEEQRLLTELDKRLWTAADILRSILSVAEYLHAVLGLIFLKYISHTVAEGRDELERQLKDPNDWATEVVNPRYIYDLLNSVIHLSTQTVEMGTGLPKLKFEEG